MKKILYFSEDMTPPFDEGIKKTAYNILITLKSKYIVQPCAFYIDKYPEKSIKKIHHNKLFLSFKLYKTIKEYLPNIIVYLPSSSGTIWSFIRLKILSLFDSSAKSVMILLQNKQLTKISRIILKNIQPDLILTASKECLEYLSKMKLNVKPLPLFVDTKRFSIIDNIDKINSLKEKYNIPIDRFIISHIGHINWGRNLDKLINLQDERNQIVIVGSSSTPSDVGKDENLKEKLLKNNIIILDYYIPDIEEIYQLSDLYIFPVEYKNGSIGLPLSILEARACGKIVLTTDFDSVRLFMGNDDGGIYYAAPLQFKEKLEEIKMDYNIKNSKIIEVLNKEYERTLLSLEFE